MGELVSKKSWKYGCLETDLVLSSFFILNKTLKIVYNEGLKIVSCRILSAPKILTELAVHEFWFENL